MSDIHLEAQWSNPLLGLLFSYHCREEKLRGLSQALCSTTALQAKITLPRFDPTKSRNRTLKLSHCSTKVRTQLPLTYSTAHCSAPHNTRVMTQRKSHRDRGEEIRNTLPASRVKTFATLEQKNLSGEIGSKRKTHPFVFKNLIPLQM